MITTTIVPHKGARLGGGHVQACPRRAVAKLDVPGHWIRALEQNQLLRSCCRHPENHELEARYSSRNWKNKLDPFGRPDPLGGVPDIYIFHCTCGRQHRRFIVGIGGPRPTWGWRERLRKHPLLARII